MEFVRWWGEVAVLSVAVVMIFVLWLCCDFCLVDYLVLLVVCDVVDEVLLLFVFDDVLLRHVGDLCWVFLFCWGYEWSCRYCFMVVGGVIG